MGIGKRIKELRNESNLTQEELAKKIGVTKGAIANYENETSHPKEITKFPFNIRALYTLNGLGILISSMISLRSYIIILFFDRKIKEKLLVIFNNQNNRGSYYVIT